MRGRYVASNASGPVRDELGGVGSGHVAGGCAVSAAGGVRRTMIPYSDRASISDAEGYDFGFSAGLADASHGRPRSDEMVILSRLERYASGEVTGWAQS